MDALTRGERCRLAVEDDLAPAGRMPPHLNRAPVGRRRFRSQRLEGRLFGREARREAFRCGASGTCPAILSLVIRKDPSYVSLAETFERSGHVLDADDIDAYLDTSGVHAFPKLSKV